MGKVLPSQGTAVPVRYSGIEEKKHGHGAFMGIGSVRTTGGNERMQGHRTWLGSMSSRVGTKLPIVPFHRKWFGAPATTPASNRMDEIIPLVIMERHRQALYESCERAPEFTSQHRNLAKPY